MLDHPTGSEWLKLFRYFQGNSCAPRTCSVSSLKSVGTNVILLIVVIGL